MHALVRMGIGMGAGGVTSHPTQLSAVKDWFLFVYARRSRTIDVQIEY